MKKGMTVALILLLGGAVMLGLCGCTHKEKEPTYRVDYCGQTASYKGAKERYKAGEHVRLTYPYIATDTDYSFYLDDEGIHYGYSDEEGFIIEFTMPAHDVTLRCEQHNSMIYDPGE